MIQNKQTEPSTASQCLGYPKAYVVQDAVLSKSLILITAPMQRFPAKQVIFDEAKQLKSTVEAKFVYSKKVKIEEKRLLKDVFQLYY